MVLVTAAICIAPYATVTLPYRLALYAQATAILVAVLVLAGVSIAAGGAVRRLRALPPRLGVGIAAWAGTAILASAVALARGNDPTLVAGQALSLGLLPLAAGAALALPTPPSPRLFSLALVVTTAGLCSIHLLHWLAWLLQGEPVFRLYFANKVAAVGTCLLALLLALAQVRDASGRRRLLAATCAAVLALYVLGSGVRGLWLMAPLAVALSALLASGGRPAVRPRTWIAALLLAIAGLASLAGIESWLEAPRPNLLPQEGDVGLSYAWSVHPESGRRVGDVEEAPAFEPDPGRAYLFRARFVGGSSGKAYAVLRWRDAEGLRLGALPLATLPAPEGRRLAAVGSPSDGAERTELAVGHRAGARGDWAVSELRVEEIGPAWVAPVAGQLLYLERRVRSIGSFLGALGGDRPVDRSVSLRLEESKAILGRIRHASPGALLFGHGLGASFVHPGTGEPTNYVHDFYLFLLFKTGLVGTVLVLGALWAWLTFCWRAMRRAAPGTPERSFLAASLAAWCGYLVWSVSSPEILDFRIAPLWGLLLAACRSASDASKSANSL